MKQELHDCFGGSEENRTPILCLRSRRPAVRRSGIIPARGGRRELIQDDDPVDCHIEKMRQNHQIVDRGHGVPTHPFEDRLRCMEPASVLHICDREPAGSDQRPDIGAGRRHVDRRRIGRHKNTTFLTEYKKAVCVLTILHTDGFVLSEDGFQ